MATKATIKATVLDDLRTAVSGVVPSNHVVLANGEDDADKPRVAYEVFGRPVEYNNGSAAAPSRYVCNNSNEVIDEVYTEYEVLRFDVRGAAHDDGTRNDIYENIREHFARYRLWLSPSDLHADVNQLTLGETRNLDESDDESTTRVDQLSIEVEYKREIRRFDSQGTTGDPIRDVDHDVDADGTVEYTTS